MAFDEFGNLLASFPSGAAAPIDFRGKGILNLGSLGLAEARVISSTDSGTVDLVGSSHISVETDEALVLRKFEGAGVGSPLLLLRNGGLADVIVKHDPASINIYSDRDRTLSPGDAMMLVLVGGVWAEVGAPPSAQLAEVDANLVQVTSGQYEGSTVLTVLSDIISRRRDRAALVEKVAGGWVPEVGWVEHVGGVSYLYEGTATTISDLPGWIAFGEWTPKHFDDLAGDGLTDVTAAVQAAANAAIASKSVLVFPRGTYVMRRVALNGSISVEGRGATILRPANFDSNNDNELTTLSVHFDITAPSLFVSFEGLTFDGNEANQSAVDPRGQSIRFAGQTGTGSTLISIRHCVFKNQTLYAINLNGQLSGNERQVALIEGCKFLDGRYGIGQGDPASASAVGFTPFSLQITDRISATIRGNEFAFTKSLATGQYAPCAARLTYFDAVTNADGPAALIEGNTASRMGRDDRDYLGNVSGNNGLGVFDFYARAREVIVSDNQFRDCLNSAVRGKTNVSSATVVGNLIHNTPRSIAITPATADTQAGNIVISSNTIHDADEVAIVVVGDNTRTPAYVQGLSIIGNVIRTVTNVRSIVGNIGGIVVRYAKTVSITGNTVTGTVAGGIYVRNCDDASIGNNAGDNIGGKGIEVNGMVGGRLAITGNTFGGMGGAFVHVNGIDTATDAVVTGNISDGSVDYGVLVLTQIGFMTVTGNTLRGVSGLSRAVYVPPTRTHAIVVANSTDAPTGLFDGGAGANLKNSLNSWNP